MAQKGTVGLLLIGAGAAVAYFTYQDLVNSQAAAQAQGAQAAASSPNWSIPGLSGQTPFGQVPPTTQPTGQKSFGSIPPTSKPGGKNTQPGTISKVGTQCPPGQVFVPIGGGTTGTCVPVNATGRGQQCPPGQVFVPIGGGTTGTCVPKGSGATPKPCWFGFLFC